MNLGNVDFLGSNLSGYFPENAFAVVHCNFDVGPKQPINRFGPLGFNPTLAVSDPRTNRNAAVVAVDHKPMPTSQMTENAIAWDGVAAGRKSYG